VAKQKNVTTNPRKIMQGQITELGNAMGAIFNQINEIRQHLLGMETLVMHLADFLKKKDKFEKFLEKKVKEQEEAQAELDKLKINDKNK